MTANVYALAIASLLSCSNDKKDEQKSQSQEVSYEEQSPEESSNATQNNPHSIFWEPNKASLLSVSYEEGERVTIDSVSRKFHSFLSTQSIYGLLGDSLNESACEKVKKQVDLISRSPKDSFSQSLYASLRNYNKVSIHSVAIPFLDTPAFRRHIKEQLKLDSDTPISIYNPFLVDSFDIDVHLQQDSLFLSLDSSEEEAVSVIKKAMDFHPISGEIFFQLSQADLACDLFEGRAEIQLTVNGRLQSGVLDPIKINLSYPHNVKEEVEEEEASENVYEHIENLLETDPCRPDIESSDLCKMTQMSFEEGELNIKEESQDRILITESYVNRFLPLVYRERFVDFLTFKEGQILRENVTMTVSTHLKKIFHRLSEERKILKNVSPYFISDEAQSLLERLINQYKSTSQKVLDGHNFGIMGSIIQHNPQHAIVALDNFTLSGLFSRKYLCTQNTDEIKRQASTSKEALEKLIKGHNISYTNLSKGFSERDFQDEFKKLCGVNPQEKTLLALVSSFEGLMAVLAGDEHLILVESAAYEGNVGTIDRDESRYPFRIRAGAVNILESDLNAEGVLSHREKLSTLRRIYKATGVHADVYVNLGLDLMNRMFPSTFTSAGPLGVGSCSVGNVHSTSLAAPLALSRVIAIKEELYPNESLDREKFQAIKDRLIPKKCHSLLQSRCIFQDPVKNKMLLSFSVE